jgi:hypothetical protein
MTLDLDLTPDDARQLRHDVAVVLAHVARYPLYYRLKAPNGRRFRVLRDALPRFGCGEPVTPRHLRNLATVASWLADNSTWKSHLREAARRVLDGLDAVDVYPAPPRRRRPTRRHTAARK